MRKLLFCSALIFSATLVGCGDEDNIQKTLPALPETCSSTNDCVSGTAAGMCVNNRCLRYCEDRSDCEDGTICESGVCRPIVDCPQMDFTESYREFAHAKCLEVFSHTPAVNWVRLLREDVRLNTVYGHNASTDFTSKNFTFQIPNRSLMGGLNYGLSIALGLTYIVLENMASTLFMQCVMPDHVKEPHEYQITLDPSQRLSLIDGSLFLVCDELANKNIWNDFVNQQCDESTGSEFRYMDRFNAHRRMEMKHYGSAEDHAIAEKCDQALLAWNTLEKVSRVISEMTMSEMTRSSTNHAIQWVLALLSEGNVRNLPQLTNVHYNDRELNLRLPLIASCEDLVKNMREIQTTICNDFMYGISENPMAHIFGQSHMDFVSCLTNENTATSLVQNAWTLVDSVTRGKLPYTLPTLAQTLMAVLDSNNPELAASFSSMSAMVNALGDPSFIWLTENNIQELNILSNQTSNNPFSRNALMLGINYKPQSSAITNTKVDLAVYESGAVRYDPMPSLSDHDSRLVGTNPYTMHSETVSVAGLLSRPQGDGKYEFYVTPVIANNQPLTCGGVMLDVSAVKGYVVLTDDQIKTMKGTALITYSK